ncbi:MAG: hypothetical protein P8Z68_07895, partial [Kineosporiaceae bacterium]
MPPSLRGLLVLPTATVLLLSACGGSGDGPTAATITAPPPSSTTASGTPRTTTPTPMPTTPTATATAAPARAGNPSGHVAVPAAGRAVDTTHPTRVVGDGTKASCTSAAVVSAVAKGGIITFDCGPDPVTITMAATAKVRNANPLVVLDGGGLITLSGGGKRRILYQNTCDQAQGWTTSHCNDQSTPRLVVQNLTFADGNSAGQGAPDDDGGGGAVFVRGGRFSVVNSTFVRNRCESTGPDLGGAAIRVLDQYDDAPVYVTSSTFGGKSGQGGRCANGGALSSIGVSWVVSNSLFTDNSAIGQGANPARSGTPGGGSGGAIYADGNAFTIRIAGTRIE